MQTVTQQLIKQYQESPEKIAIILQKTGENDQPLTYRNIIEGAARYASMLKSKGIGMGDVVVLIQAHSIDLVYGYFGIILNGSIPTIMPFLTEKLRPEKYRHDFDALIEITKPAAIITYNGFKQEIEFLNQKKSSIKEIIYKEEVYSGKQEILKEYPGLKRIPDDILLLQHSSGTTGLQKGVALSHSALFNQIESYRKAIKLSHDDVIISWLPLYHDMGLIAGFLMPILYDVQLVLMSPFDWVKSPVKLMKAISQYHGTICWLPNFAYNFCASKIRDRDLEGINLTSIRAFINCSEPMRYQSHKMFYDRFREYGLENRALTTCYAMAENVFAVTQDGIEKPVTYDRVALEDFQTLGIARKSEEKESSIDMVSAGKAIEGTCVRVIDQNGNSLPERRLGEIVIKGNCMLTGYYNRTEETKNSMIDGWFKTGDLGYLANDELFISGRKKDLIIVGGKNIYPQDIESIVSEMDGIHPGRVVAFGLFNEEIGTEDVVVIAEIETDCEGQEQDIIKSIRSTVTQSTAISLRHVILVEKNWLIKTTSGKISRTFNREKLLKERPNL